MGTVLTAVRAADKIVILRCLPVVCLYECGTDHIRVIDASSRIAERQTPFGRKARVREVLGTMPAVRCHNSETILERILSSWRGGVVKVWYLSVEATATEM